MAVCKKCKGNKKCPTCKGSGTLNGEPCPRCPLIRGACFHCHGTGKERG
jgi:hypothetical protein